jgi:DNA-binding transcriptional MerR regulator/methylmalonyl-CoA mutase cobalamin-binding subunit
MTGELNGRTYSLRAVVRTTGLSEHVLRAWERRYGVVAPGRTPGGTRRYSEMDVARLALLRQGVDAGHSIGALATLSDAEIRRLLDARPAPPTSRLDELLAAVQAFDAREIERLLSTQLHALGPRAFASEVVAPLLYELGARWERGELPISAEHMTTSAIRSLLGVSLRASGAALGLPPVLVTTPAGEVHEFGALIAAVAAVAAGGNAIYLGSDLPQEEVALAAERLGAAAVALSVVTLDRGAGLAYLRGLRERLAPDVQIWIGGSARERFAELDGIRALAGLEDLEREVRLLIEVAR